jgi:hypothetical protein
MYASSTKKIPVAAKITTTTLKSAKPIIDPGKQTQGTKIKIIKGIKSKKGKIAD